MGSVWHRSLQHTCRLIKKLKRKICLLIWLAKCCKIQQLAYLYSTTYIYAQQNIFLFNSLQLYSTFNIYVQQYAFSFHIQLNYFHSTSSLVELVGLVIQKTKSFPRVIVKKTFQVTCGVASFQIQKMKLILFCRVPASSRRQKISMILQIAPLTDQISVLGGIVVP